MSRIDVPPDPHDWAHGLSQSFLTCRDYGHAWRPVSARLADEGTYIRAQRCTRCRTEREQTLSMSGYALSGSYSYPDGYLAPSGMGRLTRDDRGVLRIESVLRMIRRTGDDDA